MLGDRLASVAPSLGRFLLGETLAAQHNLSELVGDDLGSVAVTSDAAAATLVE